MKKYFALLISLILVMSLFVACSDTSNPGEDDPYATGSVQDPGGNTNNNDDVPEYDLEGTWEASVTLYDLTNGSLILTPAEGDEAGASAATAVEEMVNNTTVTYKLSFNGDKYTMSVDKAEFDVAVNTLVDIYLEHYKTECAIDGLTIDEFFAENGTTADAFRADVVKAMGNPSESGTWSLSGTKLFLGKTQYFFDATDDSEFAITANDIYFLYTKA